VTIPRLYAVIDADVAAAYGWTVIDLAHACLDGGATWLQLRAKARPLQWTLDAADQIVAIAGDRGTVIVNDRADVARLAAAGGVHVGQDDLSPVDARHIVGERRVIGRSTHTREQIDRAIREPIDYVAVGPIYGTVTKDTGYDAVGPELIRYAAAQAAPLPIVAIGGITLDRAASAIAAGASSVAVISDLLTGGNPAVRVKTFVERLAAIEAAL